MPPQYGGEPEEYFGSDTAEWNTLVSAAASGDHAAEQEVIEVLRGGVRSYFEHHLGIDDPTTEVNSALSKLAESLRAGEVDAPENLLSFVLAIMQEQIEAAGMERGPEQPSTVGEPHAPGDYPSTAHERLVDAVYELSEVEQQILDGLYRLGETSQETQRRLGLQEEGFNSLKARAKSQMQQARRRS
jgi:DNA-directed RNA polymerase specialized sigma24 family protein